MEDDIKLSQDPAVLCHNCGELSPIDLLSQMLRSLNTWGANTRLAASLATGMGRVKEWCQQADVVCSGLTVDSRRQFCGSDCLGAVF